MSEREIERLEARARELANDKRLRDKQHLKLVNEKEKLHDEELKKIAQQKAQIANSRKDGIRQAEQELNELGEKHKYVVDRNLQEFTQQRKREENALTEEKEKVEHFLNEERNHLVVDLEKHKRINEAKSQLLLDNQTDQQKTAHGQIENAEKTLSALRIEGRNDLEKHTEQMRIGQKERNNEIKADIEERNKVIQNGKLQLEAHRTRQAQLEAYTKESQILMMAAHNSGQTESDNATTVKNVINKHREFETKFKSLGSRMSTITRSSSTSPSVLKMAQTDCEKCENALEVLFNKLDTLSQAEIDDRDGERQGISIKAKTVIEEMNDNLENLSSALRDNTNEEIRETYDGLKQDAETLRKIINEMPVVKMRNHIKDEITRSLRQIKQDFLVDPKQLERQKKVLYAVEDTKPTRKPESDSDDDSD